MNLKKYRQWVRFHQLKNMMRDISDMDREMVYSVQSEETVEQMGELVKTEYTAIDAYPLSKLRWSVAFQKAENLELPNHADEWQTEWKNITIKYTRLGKELFEEGS